MTHWNHTSFVQHSDLAELLASVTFLFQREGYVPCPMEEVADVPDHARILRYGTDIEAEVWGVAVLPSETEWCVVKTSPFNLLGRPPAEMVVPRLATICKMLCCHAILITLEDIEFYVLECSAIAGYQAWGAPQYDERILDLYLCGDDDPERERERRWSERFFRRFGPNPLYQPATSESFPLLSELCELSLKHDRSLLDYIEEFGQRLTGENGDYFSNYVQAEHLIECVPLDVPGSMVAYFRRTAG